MGYNSVADNTILSSFV